MIRFLLRRPIGVSMAFIIFFLLGIVAYFSIPISMLPSIDIPEVIVKVSSSNSSARELENNVIRPLRQQLLQVGKVSNIKSEAQDGNGKIKLTFDFGTNTDLAFIEVNEKVDAAMGSFPREIERPKVVKANASDIPVFLLHLTIKEEKPNYEISDSSFLNLSEFTEAVVKPRLEQLKEVAMVDITGSVSRQLQIIPDIKKLQIMGITLEDIESTLISNNITPRSILVKNGHYEYNIKLASILYTQEDVQNIYINKNGRLFRFKDFAKIEIVPNKQSGIALFGGRKSITLGIIKQENESINNMKETVNELLQEFSAEYPNVAFNISQNHTELLEYTITNLKQDLIWGLILIFLVAVVFLGDIRSPIIIGIIMIVSLVICFLFFYIFKISLNIISLSGLIFALGTMIDNSIIITENISQYKDKGCSLEDSCIRGTNELIIPILSSSLTSIAVFVPLIFLSGIAGAMFLDEALAVTFGLFVSFLTGIVLLPVLYQEIYRFPKSRLSLLMNLELKIINTKSLYAIYERSINFAFKYKRTTLFILLSSIFLCIILFQHIEKSRMPSIDQNELIAQIEWNENIYIEENYNRVRAFLKSSKLPVLKHSAYIGQQQFLLNQPKELSRTEAEIYFQVENPENIIIIKNKLREWLNRNYPTSNISFSPPLTIYERLFNTSDPDIIYEVSSKNKETLPSLENLQDLEKKLNSVNPGAIPKIVLEDQLSISVNHENLLLYNVNYNDVYRILKTSFNENKITTLYSFQQDLPVFLINNKQSVEDIFHNSLVPTMNSGIEQRQYVPLKSLINIESSKDLKTITAGKNGEFIPINFYNVPNGKKLMEKIKNIQLDQNWTYAFSGQYFSNKQMLNELIIVLIISVLLMYFILAAQFESFSQPLVILLELPIGIASALFMLKLCGYTLNLMSLTGIIVTCGIIINDSILKIDAINELRKKGMPLLEAIHEGGRRRLRPIIMTSLTAILAMTPFLFSYDMGSQLQKPFSVAMIAAMIIGTIVSLISIPVVYWMINQRKKISLR